MPIGCGELCAERAHVCRCAIIRHSVGMLSCVLIFLTRPVLCLHKGALHVAIVHLHAAMQLHEHRAVYEKLCVVVRPSSDLKLNLSTLDPTGMGWAGFCLCKLNAPGMQQQPRKPAWLCTGRMQWWGHEHRQKPARRVQPAILGV